MISQYTLTVVIIVISVLLHGIAYATDERSSSLVHMHTAQSLDEESFIAVEQEQYELGDEISYSSSPSLNVQKHTHNDSADQFYAWNLNSTSFMSVLFPNLYILRDAWENYPLLSKVSFDCHKSIQRLNSISPLNSIPTIFHNRSSTLQYKHLNQLDEDPLMSVLSIKDTITILSDPTLHHLKDYKVMKTIKNTIEGEYTVAIPTKDSYIPIKDITNYVNNDGASLIVLSMNRRWKKITQMLQIMEEELRPKMMNVNMYLTPEVKNGEEVHRGVVAHYDTTDGKSKSEICEHKMCTFCFNSILTACTSQFSYNMIVIIVQLAGMKRWSVAREPNIYLAGKSVRHSPTPDEVRHFSENNRFLDFTLCPGDVLYIPRGNIHNASTIDFPNLQRQWKDYDMCPDYPSHLEEAAPLLSALDEPSMHLTFSINSEESVENLIHYALHEYFASDERGYHKNDIVIPAKTCPSPTQEAMSHDVRIKSVLHHALAAVANRPTDCDNPSYRGLSANKPRRECGATLRKLVPFLLLENNELRDIKTLSSDRQVDLRILKNEYFKALDIFRDSANITDTIAFIESLVKNRIPTQGADKIACPDALYSLSASDFSEILDDFIRYAKSNFYETYKHMNKDGKESRDAKLLSVKESLQKVGQGQGGVI